MGRRSSWRVVALLLCSMLLDWEVVQAQNRTIARLPSPYERLGSGPAMALQWAFQSKVYLHRGHMGPPPRP